MSFDRHAKAPFVIVGAGQCAAAAAQSLRRLGYDGDVVIYGDEPFNPYRRPHLSKSYLAGGARPEGIALLSPDFYASNQIELCLGQRAVGIDRHRRRLMLDHDVSRPYAKLLLATGARARRLPIRVPRMGVHYLRGIDDAERLRAHLAAGARLVVIGAGYVGLEVAAKARMLGVRVTVVETAPRILNRVVSEPVAAHFHALHVSHGVDIRVDAKPVAIEGDDQVRGVLLAEGGRIAADLVVIGVGAVPNVELASTADLASDGGIVVNEMTATADPHIFAAGDVARFPSRLYNRMLRLESVQNAVDQAKIAAGAMLGETVAYDPIPWFWSDQYETKLQIAGLSDGYDAYAIIGEPGSGKFSVDYFREDRLIAVDAINATAAYMDARRRLAEGFAVE